MARHFVRGGTVSRVSGKRRETRWIASTDETALTNLAAGTAILDQSLGGAVDPFTIIRTRGHVWIGSDQTTSSEDPFGAFGMAIVSDQVVAVGVTAVPTPFTEDDSDYWFVHDYFAQGLRVLDATGASWAGLIDTPFDSKAMRKVNPDESCIFVLENGSSSHAFDFLVKFRQLIKVA